MREILFKAKRIDNGEWIIGSLIQTPYLGSMRSWISSEQDDKTRLRSISTYQAEWRAFEVKTDTVCQYTGLTDKNGQKIWENDVVAYWDTYSTENGYAEADCVGKVIWDNETLSFQVTERLSAESYEVLDECSVIGNVFDNPELINE